LVWQLSQKTSPFLVPASTYYSLFSSVSGSRPTIPFFFTVSPALNYSLSFSLSFMKPNPFFIFFFNFACTEDYSPLLFSRNIEFKTPHLNLFFRRAAP